MNTLSPYRPLEGKLRVEHLKHLLKQLAAM